MLEVRDLAIRARGQSLIEGVGFTLEEGRLYALLGENGSGKTTLMRALSSYYHNYSGSICFDGHELRTMDRASRKAAHALLPQHLPDVDLAVEALFDEGLERLGEMGLSALAQRRVSTLSGGERQLVFLALMLSRSASVYLLDEAEASLDERHRRLVEDVMLSLKREGRTVLASFHDINRALSLADSILVMSHGRLVFDGTADEFADSGLAERNFGLRERRLVDEDGETVRLFL